MDQGLRQLGRTRFEQQLCGYDLTSYGAIAGLDKSYGEMLLGLAGGMAMTEISQTDGDSSDAETRVRNAVCSWGTLSWFGDIQPRLWQKLD